MTMPFYVPPEQQMKDRAAFARQGIARGRSVVVLRYRDGVCFVAENPSATLHKVSEIYDRIGFAAVGRYHEFDALRIAGIQQADLLGYTYDRADVSARALINSYAQVLGSVFASVADKPFEVELALAEIGSEPAGDRIYRVTYDGSIFDEREFTAMGGSADVIATRLAEGFAADASLGEAVALAADALGVGAGSDGDTLLEVAALDRTWPRDRKFVRITREAVAAMVRG